VMVEVAEVETESPAVVVEAAKLRDRGVQSR
jgi:hypothetical protein